MVAHRSSRNTNRGQNSGRGIALRSKKNELALVSRLPVEIMAKIFKLVQKDYDDDEEDDDGWYWIAISHVCRLWRSIAIGTQELWTFVKTDLHAGPPQTEAYLKRSGTSQLVVHHVVEDDNTSLRCLSLALTQFHRIRELQIRELDEIPPAIIALLMQPAPVLQCFVFQMKSELSFDVNSLLSGHAPRLEHLKLSCHATSWANMPFVRCLKSLTLGTLPSPVTLNDALSIFMANPNLEKVSINSMRALTTSGMRSMVNRIQLPFMKDIHVSNAHYEILSRLVDSIVVPKTMSWDLYCESFPFNEATPKRISPRTSTGDQNCTTLFLTLNPYYVRIETDPLVHEKSTPTRFLECMWMNEGPLEVASAPKALEIIQSVVKGGFWCTATELRVDIEADEFEEYERSYRNLSPTNWKELLLMLPKLRKLEVQCVTALVRSKSIIMDAHLSVVTCLSAASLANDGSMNLICPDLSELHLNGFNLGAGLDHFLQVMNLRKSNGLQLRKFKICNPYAPANFNVNALLSSGIADNVVFTYKQPKRDNADSESDEDTDMEE